LSSFFQFAVDAGVLDDNPAESGRRPALPATNPSATVLLSAEAVEAYLASARALDARLDALVSLLVFDGLKLGEALALDVADVRGRPPNITVLVRRRRDRDGRVILTRRSAGAVYRCANRRTGEPLFTGPARNGVKHRLTRFGADHLLKQLDATGVAVSANMLRRFHITAHHETGATLAVVRDRAGLDDVRSVRRYLRPSDDGGAAEANNPDQPELGR
jgi:integrase